MMYAVTGAPEEYIEEKDEDGAVTLFLIEECRADTDERWGDYAGWDLYWVNDGTELGCICITDADMNPTPVCDQLGASDIFTAAQLRTIEEGEHVIIPAPFGVRHRVLDREEDRPDYYFDINQIMNAGRIDYWKTWESRLGM